MRKLIPFLIGIFTTIILHGAVAKVNSSTNGTRVNGYYMLEDFEGYAIDYAYPKSVTQLSALVKASPTNTSEKAVLYAMGSSGNSNVYIRINTALPAGKVLADFDSIVFNRYLVSVSYKQFAVWINGTKVHQVNNLNGTNVDNAVVKFKISEFNQSGAATTVANAGNNPEIGLGITDFNNNTSFYIDNVKLSGGGAEIPSNIYTVILNPGTGTCASSSLTETAEGAGVTLPSATPSAKCVVAGYTFAGWAASAVAETTVQPTLIPAGAWAISQNTTLYAVYTDGTVYNTNPTCNVSLNGTVSNGWLLIEDYEGKNVADPLEMKNIYNEAVVGTAVVASNPTVTGEKTAHIVITSGNYNTFLKMNVTLPTGKSASDYESISFDLYRLANDGNYKKMHVWVDGVNKFTDVNFIQQAPATTWTTKTYALSSMPEVNSFELVIGISTDAGNYMIDNVKLKEKVVVNTYTVSFDPGAGTSATTTLTETANASGVTLPTANPSTQAANAGWALAGWSLQAVHAVTVAPTMHSPASVYYPESNVTLYAVYTANGKYDSYPTTAQSVNGTISNRILMLEDFETKQVGLVYNIFNLGGNTAVGNAKVTLSPSSLNERAVQMVTNSYENIIEFDVALPEGKVLSAYDQLMFDFYWKTNDWKKMNIYVDGVKVFEDNDYISQGVVNQWNTKNYALNASSGNTLKLAIGISTDAGNYYLDNIRIRESSTTGQQSVKNWQFNYANSQLTFDNLVSVEIVDLHGRNVISANDVHTFNISHLNSGVYVVRILADGNLFIAKILK